MSERRGATDKMMKLHSDGTIKPWRPRGAGSDWIVTPAPSTEPNLRCECGADAFHVCFWDYPYSGGYLRLVCAECGASYELMDDYS